MQLSELGGRRRVRSGAAPRLRLVVAAVGLATAIGLGFASTGTAEAASSQGPVSVPITTKTVTQGGAQFNLIVINVSVAGGPTVPVELDTGSSGLVIFSSDVGPKTTGSVGKTLVRYGGGPVVGTATRGPITVGSLTAPANTIFLSLPDTPQNRAQVGSRTLGIEGILGVGPSDNESTFPLYSPLAQLPSPYWQGITVMAASSGTGSLLVGPVNPPSSAISAPLAPDTPPKFASGRPAYLAATSLCWQLAGVPHQCGPTVVDTGTLLTAIDPFTLPGFPAGNGISVDAGVQITLTSPSGAQIWSYTTGSTPTTGLTAYFPHKNEPSITGINIFFGRTIAFNLAKGQLQVWPAS